MSFPQIFAFSLFHAWLIGAVLSSTILDLSFLCSVKPSLGVLRGRELQEQTKKMIGLWHHRAGIHEPLIYPRHMRDGIKGFISIISLLILKLYDLHAEMKGWRLFMAHSTDSISWSPSLVFWVLGLLGSGSEMISRFANEKYGKRWLRFCSGLQRYGS